MKKISLLLVSIALLMSCQNELYEDATEKYQSELGVYIATNGILQSYVEEGKEVEIDGLKISLSAKTNETVSASIITGRQEQLDAYNKKNETSYVLLPKEMYEVDSEVTFEPLHTVAEPTIRLKNIKFSTEGNYALPIRVEGKNATAIGGQQETLLVLEQRIVTKSLKMGGYGTSDNTMFPDDFKVPQWTMEAMIKRPRYIHDNQAICGTELLPGSGAFDEIYPRFGDVTINPNQLQIKTGSSQIDVPSNKFTASPNVWYMISFVYDGKKTMIYVNGELVADREIREGPYSLKGFWIGGANDLIREVRFWSVARSPQQINESLWKMVNPKADGLLLYYPGNGKKFNPETNEVTEDETMIWDWSKNQKHLELPRAATFDDNNGLGYTFPPVSN